MKLFGERLHKLRTEKKIQQKEIALLLGISKSTMSLYEAGKVKVPPDKLQILADYFGVSVDYLLGNNTPFHEELHLPPNPNVSEEAIHFAKQFDQLSDEGKKQLAPFIQAMLDEAEKRFDKEKK